MALGFGIYISLKVFNIPDITTDGSFTLGGAVTAVMLSSGYGVPITIIISILASALAGVVTGLVHTKLKVNALLAGILVMTGLYSVNLMVMSRSNIPIIDVKTVFNLFGSEGSKTVELCVVSAIALLIIIILTYLLSSDFGLAMRATGNNEQMIRAMGVNTDYMKVVGMGIANGLTGLSGSVVAQYQGFADINMGIGIVILGLGSVMIGETIMNLFKVNSLLLRLLGVVLGCVIFRIIIAASLAFGADPNQLRLITAVIVLAFVALPNVLKKIKY